MKKVVLVFCVFFVADLASGAPLAKRHFDLALYPEAVCNDGTPSGYYFRAAVGTGIKRWVIHLEGGGFCENVTECSKRQAQWKTSSGWPSTVSPSGIMNPLFFLNRDFYNANHVYVKYCSSDLWSGDRAASPQTGNLHFRGHKIVTAMIEDLKRRGELKDASDLEIVFNGTSAGGIGAMINLDRVAAMLPLASAAGRFKGVNDAGWIPDIAPHVAGMASPLARIRDGLILWGGKLDTECLAANPSDAGKCYFGQYAFSHVSTPLFVEGAQLDAVILAYLGVVPFYDTGEWHYIDCTFAPAMRSTLEPVSGAFSAVTGTHGMITSGAFWGTSVNGYTFRDLFSNWFFENAGKPVKQIQDRVCR